MAARFIVGRDVFLRRWEFSGAAAAEAAMLLIDAIVSRRAKRVSDIILITAIGSAADDAHTRVVEEAGSAAKHTLLSAANTCNKANDWWDGWSYHDRCNRYYEASTHTRASSSTISEASAERGVFGIQRAVRNNGRAGWQRRRRSLLEEHVVYVGDGFAF